MLRARLLAGVTQQTVSNATFQLPGLTPPASSDARRRGRRWLAVICVALGFLACAAVVRLIVWQWLPQPELAGLEDALAALEAHREQADVVFLGTSHVLRGIDPAVFDREARRQGLEVSSVTVGARGLRAPGQRYLLERIEALAPPRLRYVVVEPRWQVDVQPRNRNSERVLALYDPAMTSLAARSLLAGGGSPADLMEVLRAGSYHLLSVGRLARALLPDSAGSVSSERSGSTRRQKLVEHRGYRPQRSPRDGRRPKLFARRVARMQDTMGRRFPRAKVEPVARTFRRIREMGAEPVAVIPPNTLRHNVRYRATHRRLFGDTPLLAFNDPDRHPELYRLEVYQDAGAHLNRQGAVLFSQMLARRFAREVVRRGAKTAPGV